MRKFTTVFLGSIDNEMTEIEALARNLGLEVVYAFDEKGNRIRPGAKAVNAAEYDHEDVVWIEQFVRPERALDIDHHGASPFTNFPPEKFWEASSLGQFCNLFGIEPTPDLLAVAAADHCMAAAAQGRCPGVDLGPDTPQREALLRRARRNFAPKMSEEEFLKACAVAAQTLRDNQTYGEGADLRHLHIDGPIASTGEQYPSQAQFLPVVASLEGIPYIVHIRRGDGWLALRMGGFDGGNEEHRQVIQAFLNNPSKLGCLPCDAPSPNNAYGSPERGIGGGTLSEQDPRI
jgi:hypothetical protein